MLAFATHFIFFLSLFSLAKSSPVVRQVSEEAKQLEDRALINLPVSVDLGTVNLGVRALV